MLNIAAAVSLMICIPIILMAKTMVLNSLGYFLAFWHFRFFTGNVVKTQERIAEEDKRYEASKVTATECVDQGGRLQAVGTKCGVLTVCMMPDGNILPFKMTTERASESWLNVQLRKGGACY